MTMLDTSFNPAAALHPRAKKPFVLVYMGSELNPTRGDAHGYIGIAERVAERTGGEYYYLDDDMLETMYPHVARAPHDDGYRSNKDDPRLMAFFKDRGMPDFFFSRNTSQNINDYLDQNGNGVMVTTINESLYSQLKNWEVGKPKLVPHHLTAEKLKYEGDRFATEYQELPRPFIGILIASDVPTNLAQRLADLQQAYENATFFICSSHRTNDHDYKNLITYLEDKLEGAKGFFPVIGFNFNHNMQQSGMANFWNPYMGLLDQSDHLILSGMSESMLSEAVSTGKTLHVAYSYSNPQSNSYLKNAFDYSTGAPFVTKKISMTDQTEACASAIIQRHAEYASLTRNFCRAIGGFIMEKVLRNPAPVKRYDRI